MTTQHADVQSEKLQCPVCGTTLEIRLAKGRTSKKPFIMAVCPVDGRHIRSFINDAAYVRRILGRLEGQS